MIDEAIDLAREAVEAVKTDPTTDGSELMEHIALLLEEANGVRPSVTEVATIVKEIVGEVEPRDDWFLCDLKTREQLIGVPALAEPPGKGDIAKLSAHGLTALPYSTIEPERLEREAKQRAERNAAEAAAYRKYLASRVGITLEMYDALVAFAGANGRTWKQKLRTEWEAGTAGETLQFLRNHPNFGPSGLAKFKLPTSAAA